MLRLPAPKSLGAFVKNAGAWAPSQNSRVRISGWVVVWGVLNSLHLTTYVGLMDAWCFENRCFKRLGEEGKGGEGMTLWMEG